MTRKVRDYSARDIERSVEWFDWSALLEQQGISAYPRGDELVAQCPFCHHGGRESFFLNSVSGVFFCHVCGETGGPVRFVARIVGVRYPEAVRLIMQGSRHQIEGFDDYDDDEEDFETPAPLIELPEDYLPLTGDTSISGGRYRDYLYGRGVTDALIEEYEIGFCALGHLAGFVIIPVYHLGQLVTYIARSAARNARQKVWTPPGNEEGDYLFNLDHLWGKRSVVITEGVFDALALPQHAVATFGKKLSVPQQRALKAAGVKELIFCWDEDALRDSLDAIDVVRERFIVKVIELPDGTDPSELGHDEMMALLPTASRPTRELG